MIMSPVSYGLDDRSSISYRVRDVLLRHLVQSSLSFKEYPGRFPWG